MWVSTHILSVHVYAYQFLVPSLTTGPRVEEAMERSVRWLDRCAAFHEKSGKTDRQNLFAIVQGALDPALRDRCLNAMIDRKSKVMGYAIGGLSGGEEKGEIRSRCLTAVIS